MSIKENIGKRRAWVIFNYSSIVALVVLFVLHREFNFGTWSIVTMAALLALTFGSFFVVYMNTGLWKLVHAKEEELDERQRQVTYDALQHSYAIFSVLTLLIIFYFAWKADDWSILLFGGLVYIAHILPASIIAWKEKIVG